MSNFDGVDKVNPYSHLGSRVSGVRDDSGKRRRQGERQPDEPHDVVDLHDEAESPEKPEQGSGPDGDGLDIAV